MSCTLTGPRPDCRPQEPGSGAAVTTRTSTTDFCTCIYIAPMGSLPNVEVLHSILDGKDAEPEEWYTSATA